MLGGQLDFPYLGSVTIGCGQLFFLLLNTIFDKQFPFFTQSLNPIESSNRIVQHRTTFNSTRGLKVSTTEFIRHESIKHDSNSRRGTVCLSKGATLDFDVTRLTWESLSWVTRAYTEAA